MDKDDRTGSSVRLVDQTVWGSVQVPRWSGGNRMGETCRHDENRWINLHVAKHGMCFAQMDSVFWRRIEKGYFGNLTKYRLCDFWLNHGAGWRMLKWFRSREVVNDALKSVRKCPVCLGLNGSPLG